MNGWAGGQVSRELVLVAGVGPNGRTKISGFQLTLTMSRDIFIVTTWWGRCYWHIVGGDLGCC